MPEPIVDTLSCGLPLLICEQHDVAVATVDVWVRTGGADEPPELGGVSHFLEHMLFKGTAKYGLGEIERRIECCGGQSNAGTSHDYTHYYVTLPSRHVATAIDMLAEMVCHSVLDGEELEKERLVILEEYRRKQDHPAGVLYERLYAELFRAGRYHHPVIGTEATIQAISREAMLDYYRQRYSPATMTLVVAGDVDPQAVRGLAERAFAGFDRPARTLRPAAAPELGSGVRVEEVKPTGGEAYIAWAWPAPGFNQGSVPTLFALDAARTILGGGRAARLYQTLKEARGLCSAVSTHYVTHAAESLFAVSATCLPGQRTALRAALGEELEAWCAAPPAEAELERVRRLLRSAHHFSLETTDGVAMQLGYYQTLTGSVRLVTHYTEGIDAVTPELVQAAAEEVLVPGEIAARSVEVSIGPE